MGQMRHLAQVKKNKWKIRQIQPCLQLPATKHQDFLRTAAHLPASDGSSFANEGLAPGASLHKENRRQHTHDLRATMKHCLILKCPTIKISMIGNPPIDRIGWRPLSQEAPGKGTQLGHQRRRLPWPFFRKFSGLVVLGAHASEY